MRKQSARLALAAFGVLAAGSPAFANATLSALQPVQGGCAWVRVDAAQRDVLATLPLDSVQTAVTWSPDGRAVAFWGERIFYAANGGVPVDLHWPGDRELVRVGFDAQNRLVALGIAKARLSGHSLIFEGRSYPAKPFGHEAPELAQALRYTNGRWQVVESVATHEADSDEEVGSAGVWALKTRLAPDRQGDEWTPKNAVAADDKLAERLRRAEGSRSTESWWLLKTPYGAIASRGENDDYFLMDGPLFLVPPAGPIVPILAAQKDSSWQVHREGASLLAAAPSEAWVYDLARRQVVLHARNVSRTAFWPATLPKVATSPLERRYQEVLADLNPAQRLVLAASQAAWAKYRDAELALESLPETGGPQAARTNAAIAQRLEQDRMVDFDDCSRLIDNAPADAPRRVQALTVDGALKADAAYARDDAALNRIYTQLAHAPWIAHGDGKQRLPRAELAWMAWRDAEAKLDAIESTDPVGAYSTQLDDLTTTRTHALEKLLSRPASGLI